MAAAATKCRAILAMVEEVGVEPDGGLPLKQKGQAEGEWTVCDHRMTQGFDCQVSQI